MMSTPPRIGNDEPERRKRSANAEEEDGPRKKNDGGIDMGGEREEGTVRDSSRAPPEAQNQAGSLGMVGHEHINPRTPSPSHPCPPIRTQPDDQRDLRPPSLRRLRSLRCEAKRKERHRCHALS